MRFVPVFLVSVALAAPVLASGAIRLDLGANSHRNDTGARKWDEWPVDNGAATAERKVGDATIKLRPIDSEPATLQSVLSKPELAVDARLVCDGVFVSGKNAKLEVVLRGLSAGPHTVTTFHNSVWPGKSVGTYRISIVGGNQTDSVTPPKDLRHDDDIGTAHLQFDAPADGQVVVRIEQSTPGEKNVVILNALAIDEINPRRQALKPTPKDADEHADGENGKVQLKWNSAATTKQHRVYLAHAETDNEAVAALSVAKPDTKWLVATVEEPNYSANIVDKNSLLHYAWRVDEVDTNGVATPGRVWTFRVRHIAFPGAEGYGRFALGGRGGKVYHVTTLNDSGPGSLREGVEATGPRTIVFDVGGLISLKTQCQLRNPYLTIAGQTAPGKGICIRNYVVGGFASHDLIMRYVRLRLGDLANLSMDGTGLASCDNSIFDHLSVSWALDESVSSRGAGNITLQRSIVSEALLNHPRFSGGYGGSIGGEIASLHHNLLAHNAGRNWSLAGALDKTGRHTGRLDIRNNVVYNWEKRTNDGGSMVVQLMNNYYKPGPASVVFHVLMPERNPGFGPQEYYVAGNVMEGHVRADDDWGGIIKPKNEELADFIHRKPFFESYVTTQSAAEAYENVLADVGCNVPMLDDHDTRMIHETQTGTCKYVGSLTKTPGVVNSQEDSGGWEEYPEMHRPDGWDTDGDGIPNEWEKSHGLNPMDPSDGAQDRDGDGYTALEEYLNSYTKATAVPAARVAVQSTSSTARTVPSAPSAAAKMSIQLDGAELPLSNVRIQSATVTSGRPTFVVMADTSHETVFVRATLQKAETGSHPLRSMRLRPEGKSMASLNFDCRAESGMPVLRQDGGALEVKAIAVDKTTELITRFDASFSGEMSVTSGTKHSARFFIQWGDPAATR